MRLPILALLLWALACSPPVLASETNPSPAEPPPVGPDDGNDRQDKVTVNDDELIANLELLELLDLLENMNALAGMEETP